MLPLARAMTFAVSMAQMLSTPPRSETKKRRLAGPHAGIRLTALPAVRLMRLLPLISTTHRSAEAGRLSVAWAHWLGLGTVAKAIHLPSGDHAGLMQAATGVEATS